jgi:hypothetical protein
LIAQIAKAKNIAVATIKNNLLFEKAKTLKRIMKTKNRK